MREYQFKCLSAFQERRQTLMSDGYNILFEKFDNEGLFAKLRHRNGSIIVLKLSYYDRRLNQTTDGKLVHTEKVC